MANVLHRFPPQPPARRPHKYYTLCGCVLQGVVKTIRKGLNCMERILEALANDDLSTMASTIKENPEYEKSMKEICEIENILNAALNPTESGLLKKLEDLQLDVAELSATARFIDGYRLGVLMMAEVFAVPYGSEE